MDIDSKLSEAQQSETATEKKPAVKAANIKSLRHSLIGSIVCLVALVSVFVAQTFAYFTDSSTVGSNQITTGSMNVSLVRVDGNGSFDLSADPIRVMPSSVIDHGKVGAENSGTIPVYVRIKIEKTMLNAEHYISPAWRDLVTCNVMANDDTLPEEKRDLWVYRDGYYYYKIALAPGEQTTSLFDKVIFDPQMGNEFKNCSIQFKIICQSVQSGNNSPDPTTAWGWPAEQSLSE